VPALFFPFDKGVLECSPVRIFDLREGVAEEYGIALYRSYGEKQAATFIGTDYSTLKRWRRAGKTPYVNHGERVRYMGFQIADIILFGNQAKDLNEAVGNYGRPGRGEQWVNIRDASSDLESGGSGSEKEAKPGTLSDTTRASVGHNALALARTALNAPKKN
jgi:hypothetical protein